MRVPRKVKANVFKFSFKFLKGILGLRLFVKHFLSQRAKTKATSDLCHVYGLVCLSTHLFVYPLSLCWPLIPTYVQSSEFA